MIIKWPKYLLDNITRAGQALIDKVQELTNKTITDINLIYDMTDPYRCPAAFLNHFGEELHAEFSGADDTRARRIKLITAISRVKDKSLWQTDLKIRVETVLGYEVDLYSRRSSSELRDSIFWGGTETRDRSWCEAEITGQAEIYVGGIGGVPYVDDFLPGFICIDIKIFQPPEVVQKIVDEINREGGYIGHRIFVGYLSGTVYTVLAEA